MACVKKRMASTDAYEMSGHTGTVIYMAPEVVIRQPYTEKADIYSFGMILWQMTSGIVPFAGKVVQGNSKYIHIHVNLYSVDMRREDFMDKVVFYGWRPAIRSDLPAPLKEIITRCWAANPLERPTCAEIMSMLDAAAVRLVDNRDSSMNEEEENERDGIEELSIAGWLYAQVRQVLQKVMVTDVEC